MFEWPRFHLESIFVFTIHTLIEPHQIILCNAFSFLFHVRWCDFNYGKPFCVDCALDDVVLGLVDPFRLASNHKLVINLVFPAVLSFHLVEPVRVEYQTIYCRRLVYGRPYYAVDICTIGRDDASKRWFGILVFAY